MWPELVLGNVAVLAAFGTICLGLLIKGSSLALDAIIIPNYSAVKPKGYFIVMHCRQPLRDCHYALGD